MRAFWAENCCNKNTELCFTITVPKSTNAEIYIIAKDVYNLFINGVFVHYGPARAAKNYARVDRISIDRYLKKQNNIISVYVQANNTSSLCFALEKPLFGAEIYLEQNLYCDASAFDCFKMTDKLCKVEKMSSQRGYVEIYNMERNREPFINVDYPKVNIVEVAAPQLLERNVVYANNEEKFAVQYEEGGVSIDESRVWKNDFTDLMDDLGKGNWDGYFRKECEELLSSSLNSFIFNKDAQETSLTYRTYALDRVYCGKFKLKIKAAKTSQIYLIYDDYLIDGKIKFNREQIIHGLKWRLAPGDYELYSCEVYMAKYFCLVIDGDVEIESISVICIENAETENYALYKSEHFKSDGILPMCYPSEPSNQDSYIPNWILWYVIELDDRDRRWGDKCLSPLEKEKIRAIVDFFAKHENEYGLLENLQGWLFLEWSRANDFLLDVNFPSNMLYSGMLKSAGKLLEDDSLIEKSRILRETILKMAFNGTFFVDNAIRENGQLIIQNNISETCQYFAAYFDVLTREENPDFYERIFKDLAPNRKEKECLGIAPSNMFMGYILRLTVLDRECEHERLLKECKITFAEMVKDTSTIWELFSENASCNHGFGSIVSMFIGKALIGLAEINEGEKKLFFVEETVGIDTKLSIPVKEGNVFVEVRNGIRTVMPPKGYQVIIKSAVKE